MSKIFVENDNKFNLSNSPGVHKKLPVGVYEIETNEMIKELLFKSINTNYDELLDLPSGAYDKVLSEIDYFLKDKTKENFNKYGFLYKRSTLLYGVPGGGKTCIVNRVCEKVLDKNGIVLMNPRPDDLLDALRELDITQPNDLVVVVFEELDELLKSWESELLNLLDGEVQRDNIIFLATTNYIEDIPSRLKRPGRFSNIIEVGMPSLEARSVYLKHKITDIKQEDLNTWVEKTKEFTIDELKETVLSVKCLGYTLDEVAERIIKVRNVSKEETIKDKKVNKLTKVYWSADY
jgi:SpoVK/Ycf46/Vps4 family AAA+-type ATPase